MRALFLICLLALSLSADIKELNFKPRDDENELLVQISFGKFMSVDCNEYRFLSSNLTNSDGVYKLSSDEKMIGTKMACDGKKISKFVLYPSIIILPYNSTKPILVDIPSGVKIKARVYKAIKELNF
ncbi:MAG: ecotin family protein [Campylobacter sp.]|nr:ecotin family protein [Campylobacter sp.]